MLLDELAFLGGEPAGLGEDGRRDADLADVVEERSELEPLEGALVEAELAPDAVIQRACVDVYSSFASRAFASASTVDTNVRSSPSYVSALAIASFA